MVENHHFNLHHLYLAPPSGVTPSEFRRDLWRQKTTRIALSCGIKISPVGSQSTHVTGRWTDRQTDGQNYDSQDCDSIAASRGKNKVSGILWELLEQKLSTLHASSAVRVRQLLETFPTFHSRLPLRQKVPSQSWWKLFQTLRTGNGGTSICYSVLPEDQLHN